MTLDEFNPVILNLGLAENVSGWNYHNVNSPFARLYYVIDGRARVVTGGKTYELTPGNVYVIPPFTLHDEICDSTFSHYYIHIYENPIGESIFETFDFPVAFDADEEDRAIFEHILRNSPGRQLPDYDPHTYGTSDEIICNISSEREAGLPLRMLNRGLLYCLFSRLLPYASEKEKIGDPVVKAALSYINENLSLRTLSVDVLADRACLSVNQFIRHFSREMNQTPLRYITNRRVERAQLLLLNKDTTVKSVSISVGFSDPAYFCKVFKQRIGVSPHRFREYSMKNI